MTDIYMQGFICDYCEDHNHELNLDPVPVESEHTPRPGPQATPFNPDYTYVLFHGTIEVVYMYTDEDIGVVDELATRLSDQNTTMTMGLDRLVVKLPAPEYTPNVLYPVNQDWVAYGLNKRISTCDTDVAFVVVDPQSESNPTIHSIVVDGEASLDLGQSGSVCLFYCKDAQCLLNGEPLVAGKTTPATGNVTLTSTGPAYLIVALE